ncbi:MAG: hypothetical protein ACRDRO_01275 [Pseudonocardiaceae bacterium]
MTTTTDKPDTYPTSHHRTILTTCRVHGAERFCNLRLTKTGGTIVVDPHVDGSCVIVLDERAAGEVFDAIGGWLG